MKLLHFLFCLLGILSLVGCKQEETFHYDKELLAKSRYLYVIQEGDWKYGLMNEQGKIVAPLQKIRMKKIDEDGRFFLIKEQFLSIEKGLLPASFDSYSFRSSFVFKDKTYFWAYKDSSSYLFDEEGIELARHPDSYRNRVWNDSYYSLELGAGETLLFCDSTHQVIFEIDSIYSFNSMTIPNHPNLILFSKREENNFNYELTNIRTKKSLDFKGLFRNYAFSYYDNVVKSYWEAGIDSFPYPTLSQSSLDSIQKIYRGNYNKSYADLKIFQFYGYDLAPKSKQLYSWNEISRPYNPYGRVVYNAKDKSYTLIQNNQLRTDLPKFNYFNTDYRINSKNWFYGRTSKKEQIAFFKGEAIYSFNKGNSHFVNDQYFYIQKNDSIQELRDSLGQLLIVAGKQKFKAIQYSNKDKVQFSNDFLQVQKEDSIFLLNLKTRALQFITKSYNLKYNSIEQIHPHLFLLNKNLLYNSKTRQILIDYLPKYSPTMNSAFIKLSKINSGLLKKGIIAYLVEGYYSNHRNLYSNYIYRLIDFEGNLIVDFDLSQYGSFSKAEYKPYELLEATPFNYDNDYGEKNKIFFHQDMQILWPSELSNSSSVNFIRNRDDLEAWLNNEAIEIQELDLSLFEEENWKHQLFTKVGADKFRFGQDINFEVIHINKELETAFIHSSSELNPFDQFEIDQLDSLAKGDLFIINDIHPTQSYGAAARPRYPLIIFRLR